MISGGESRSRETKVQRVCPIGLLMMGTTFQSEKKNMSLLKSMSLLIDDSLIFSAFTLHIAHRY